MTDIRASTEIINGPNGTITMFLIFYIYAGIVAKIVDYHGGTSTEFLGDGVLNLFDTTEFTLDGALRKSVMASWDILEARNKVLNPFFSKVGLPNINLGIGIDHGVTIVTRFGYRGDTDLKAFGKCVYNSSKLSKGMNQIFVSQKSHEVWPVSPNGKLGFHRPERINDAVGVPLFKIS
jgi:class 3 adenylate cyclase